MPIPAVPTAYLILIQPNLALGGFETLSNSPTRSSHTNHVLQRAVVGYISHVVSDVFWIGHTTAQQQPAFTWYLPAQQGQSGPVIQPRPLGPITSGQPDPVVSFGSGCQLLHRGLPHGRQPDILVRSQCHDMRYLLLLQPNPQA